jgi:hypothetical protein
MRHQTPNEQAGAPIQQAPERVAMVPTDAAMAAFLCAVINTYVEAGPVATARNLQRFTLAAKREALAKALRSGHLNELGQLLARQCLNTLSD